MLTFKVFWRRNSVPKSGTARFKPISRNSPSTDPVVCPSALPNGNFAAGPVWMAASPWTGCRQRVPAGGVRLFGPTSRHAGCTR
jgi:hypothetical protein